MFYLVLSLNRQPLSTNRLQNVENSLFSEHIQFVNIFVFTENTRIISINVRTAF